MRSLNVGVVLLAAFAVLVSTATGQCPSNTDCTREDVSCVPCRCCDLGNPNDPCLTCCKQECPTPPEDEGPTTDECISIGKSNAPLAGRDACDKVQEICRQPQPMMTTVALTAGPVIDLQQCENVAFGACQEDANNNPPSPCDRYVKNGFERCEAGTFSNLYRRAVEARCCELADNIQPKTPGTCPEF